MNSKKLFYFSLIFYCLIMFGNRQFIENLTYHKNIDLINIIQVLISFLIYYLNLKEIKLKNHLELITISTYFTLKFFNLSGTIYYNYLHYLILL